MTLFVGTRSGTCREQRISLCLRGSLGRRQFRAPRWFPAVGSSSEASGNSRRWRPLETLGCCPMWQQLPPQQPPPIPDSLGQRNKGLRGRKNPAQNFDSDDPWWSPCWCPDYPWLRCQRLSLNCQPTSTFGWIQAGQPGTTVDLSCFQIDLWADWKIIRDRAREIFFYLLLES